MGGLFGISSKVDCVIPLFYGTDYHSHLGTKNGGLIVRNGAGEIKEPHIHDIRSTQFRSSFYNIIGEMEGTSGIGVISDHEPQPLLFRGHFGDYGLVTVGVVKNEDELVRKVLGKKMSLPRMENGQINPTGLVAALIVAEDSIEAGIESAQEAIKGSCSMLVLTAKGIYAARDRLGRTPVVIGKNENSYAATMETCAFPNIGFEYERELGPGEIVLMTPEGAEQKKEPNDKMQMCSFLWVYYGYPSSGYEGFNVEETRYRCGRALARADEKDRRSGRLNIDIVAGIPDSGTGHGLGYSHEASIPFMRPYTKYTPTWPRSFMPQNQEMRNLVGRMKLIPVKELVEGKRLLFCEDSIVRGTQLQETVERLFQAGAAEVHMRPACPPLTYGCEFLNFSRSKSVMDLASRKAIRDLTGKEEVSPDDLKEFSKSGSEKYEAMVEKIGENLGLTSLRYQKLDDLVKAISLPKERLCTHCWDGTSEF